MCLILDCPPGHKLTEAEVRAIYSRNRQGFGYLAHDDAGDVVTARFLPRDAADAVKLYRLAQAHHGAHRVVYHWRYATHGPRESVAMAHPFHVVDGVHVVHNGIIPRYGTSTESDTAEFVRVFLRPYVAALRSVEGDALDNDGVRTGMVRELATRIGRSVLVLASAGGRFLVVDAMGESCEHGGAWYSNRYAWPAPVREVWRSRDLLASLRFTDEDARSTVAPLACSVATETRASVAHAASAPRVSLHPANPFARVAPPRRPLPQPGIRTVDERGAL